MMIVTIDGVTVKVLNGEIPMEEAEAYVKRGRELYGPTLCTITAEIDPDDPEYIGLDYYWKGKPFHRLRRITGYLVGNLSRWNNAKRAEERDRVKHDGGMSLED